MQPARTACSIDDDRRRGVAGARGPSPLLGIAAGLMLSAPGVAEASSFAGRLAVGPAYMKNQSLSDLGDSSGPAIAAQLDAGIQLWPSFVLHGTLIYDYSRWLELNDNGAGAYVGSMLGLGLGGSARFAGVALGAAAGGQFTFFPQNDDPASGPNGGSLGPFISLTGGYVWSLEGSLNTGVHALFRYRRSKDETNSIVYDPSGYQLGLVLSIGLDGEPIHGR